MTVTRSKRDDPQEPEARKLGRVLSSEELLDEVVAKSAEQGVPLTGKGGLMGELLKATLERGMDAELTDHLGYDKHQSRPDGSSNARNGTSSKTVATELGPVALDQPRDRAGTFASALVPKHALSWGSGRGDHQPLRRRDDDPRHPAPPGLHDRHGPLARDDQQPDR